MNLSTQRSLFAGLQFSVCALIVVYILEPTKNPANTRGCSKSGDKINDDKDNDNDKDENKDENKEENKNGTRIVIFVFAGVTAFFFLLNLIIFVIKRQKREPVLHLVRSCGDGKCLFHSILTGLKDLKIVDDGVTTETLMQKIKDAYETAKTRREFQLKNDLEKEIQKIENLINDKPIHEFPDIGPLLELVRNNLFPYKVAIQLKNRDYSVRVFPGNNERAETIYVTGGDNRGAGGHFDALVRTNPNRQEPPQLRLTN